MFGGEFNVCEWEEGKDLEKFHTEGFHQKYGKRLFDEEEKILNDSE